MIQGLWNWLNCNATGLQAVAATLSVLLAAVTIAVLIVTYRAARAQADAATKLTSSTDKQVEILGQQLIATRRQIEESVRPMLDVPVGFVAGATLLKGTVMNLGTGPALDITYAYATFGDRDIEEVFVVPPTVSKDKGFEITIDPEAIKRRGIIFLYRSLTGNDYASSLSYDRPHFRYHADAHEWVQLLRSRSRSSL